MNQPEITFQLIVEAFPDALVLVNAEGKIAYVNQQMEKLFGYSRTELIGQFVEVLIPARFRKSHVRYRQDFFKTPSARAMGSGRELFALRKNGVEFPVEIGLNPVMTLEGSMAIASIIDITKRKKTNELLRQVVESAPNAMVLVDPEGLIVLVNRQAESLFGYARSDLVGNKVEMLIPERFRQGHPGHRNSFFSNLETRAMGAGRDLFALKKDGSEIQVEIGLNPLETREGPRVLAAVIDITERKSHETALIKQRELELRNKELEQLTYVSSHDLREPLRTVSNYIGLIEEDYSQAFEPTLVNYIASMKKAANRMDQLIVALLDFARLGQERKIVSLDFRNLILEVLSDLQGIIQHSNAEFVIGEMPILNLFETEMRQLIQNLVTNAIKFRKSETVPQIRIQAENLQDYWKFSVTDNGIGIAPEYFDQIFHVFQRLHTSDEYEGTGIGLANCKKIIALHNGEIWVESKKGEGSVFYFTISKGL